MGRTTCTERQCLYKGDLYLFYSIKVKLNLNPAILVILNIKQEKTQ